MSKFGTDMQTTVMSVQQMSELLFAHEEMPEWRAMADEELVEEYDWRAIMFDCSTVDDKSMLQHFILYGPLISEDSGVETFVSDCVSDLDAGGFSDFYTSFDVK
jgi:hypothetical protein